MAVEVVVSLVGGGFAVLVALISKIGHDNRKDHGIVHTALGRIEQRIDGHVESHEKSKNKYNNCFTVTAVALLVPC